ncbi:MAG: hypothetical protein ACJZ8I_03910 [Paracoccaceae bacterium]
MHFLFIWTSTVFSEEIRMESSEKNWSIFVPKNKKECFIASQSVKDEAFRNGEKLSNVNRDRGVLFIKKSLSSPSGFEGAFSAGYPLKIGGKFRLTIDNVNKFVFLAHPKPKNSTEKTWAWTQSYDDLNLVEKLKVGNKAIMEAISHRGTVTKDTFILTGFTKAIQRLVKLCE